ncbi:MAG: cation diffusion facilitator family transporter [Prochloraceae cyanobacterium]
MRDNRARVRSVLIVTLLLNISVMGLKLILGLITGSLSLQADALHSLTDSANNVLGLIANQFASPYPDREHPYGHSKFEAVGALAIAAFLGIACFEILSGAIETIINGTSPLKISVPQLWLLCLVLGINIFVAFYERRVGKKIGSAILIADAHHTMSDVWVTITVLAGLIGVWQGQNLGISQLEWLDVILAFPVALLVFKSGWEVLKANLPSLVDRMAIAPEKIHRIVMEVPGVINCHDIASRGITGKQTFIEMHLVVNTEDLVAAHDITEKVEKTLEKHFSPVRIVIHVEPSDYRSSNITFGGDR